ncbi:uncharacterized protein O3C94_013895 isoform 2-T2 [Discoglossus pictus]
MNKGMKMNERILNHVLEILSLLTGKRSALQYLTNSMTVVEINKDKKLAERILTHTLEIINLLTGECDINGYKEINNENHQTVRTFGITDNMSSALQDETLDTVGEEGEDEMDGKDIVQVTIQSEVCAEPSEKNHLIVPKIEQEELTVMDYWQGKVEEMPVNISEVHCEDVYAVKKHGEDEREGKEIQHTELQPEPHTDGSMTRNIAEVRHISLGSSDCLIEDTSFSHDYTESNWKGSTNNKACVKAHKREKNFFCSDCGKGFTSNANLVKHKRIHTGEKPFACSDCGKCFSTISNLNAHKRTHTGERPYVCSDCGKCFKQASNLSEHKRTHTGKRPYTCSDCGKCFSQVSHLIEHKRSHTGERPFECSDCGKSFRRASTLNDHLKTHTGERPYACSECGKCFSQTSHLNEHKRIHTGERPFVCSDCGKCFSQASTLMAHKKTHKGKILCMKVGNL